MLDLQSTESVNVRVNYPLMPLRNTTLKEYLKKSNHVIIQRKKLNHKLFWQ